MKGSTKKSMPDMDRFLLKVSRRGECMIWEGYKNIFGYGQFQVGSRRDKTRRKVLAHRWLYEQTAGPVPGGLELDHLCRNRDCVNPGHLQPVTHLENVRRGNSGSNMRDRTECLKGHKFDPENTGRTSAGHRFCKICRRRSWAEYRNRRKQWV